MNIATKKLDILELIARGTSTSQEFFQVAAQAITMTVGSHWGGVAAQVNGPNGREIRVLALCDSSGKSLERFSFPAEGSPCGLLHDPNNKQRSLFIESATHKKFPQCQALQDLSAEAYWGESFSDGCGKVGHAFAIHSSPVERSPERESLFRLIAQRVGAEYLRTRAEDELKVARQIIRGSNDHIHVVDANLVCRFASSTLAKFMESSEAELVGQHASCLHGNVACFDSTLSNLYHRALRGESVSTIYAIDKQERRHWFSLHLIPIPESEPKVAAISRDITRQTENWESHLESATSKDVISGNVELVVKRVATSIREHMDADCVAIFRIESDNSNLRLRHEASAFVDGHCNQLRPTDDAQLLRPVLAGETVGLDGNTSSFTLNGRRPVSLLVVPVTNSQGVVGVLAVAADEARDWTYVQQLWTRQKATVVAQVITNRNRQELEKHIALSNKLESLGALAGGMAHDINNLLVPIMYGLEIALLDQNTYDPEIIESLELAKKATMNASDFCSQFLAIGRDRSQCEKPIVVAEIINKVIDLQVEFLNQHNVRVDFEDSGQRKRERLILSGAPTLLRQAISNLLRNSVEAMIELPIKTVGIELSRVESLPIDAWRATSCDPQDSFVCIAIRDNGKGMDKATANSAIEPFYTTKGNGKGLGLTVVQNAVKTHDGGMRIESESGVGTTFELYLPEFCDQVKSETARELQKLSLLLIDDNAIVRGSLTRALENEGHSVRSAASGHEALRILSNEPEIDAAIIDFHMNEMSGPETLKALRQQRHDLPAIGISGYAQIWPNDEIPILQKPFQSRELLEKIRQIPVGGGESPHS